MRFISEIFAYMLMGVFTHNMLFCGGIGIDAALRLAEKPRKLLTTTAFVTLFSLLTVLDRLLIDGIAAVWPPIKSFIVPLLMLTQALVCLLTLAILGKVSRRMLLLLRSTIVEAAFSNIVIIIGIASELVQMPVSHLFGYCIGTGIAFIFSSLIIRGAIRKIGNPDMSRAFLGLPSLLIYIGILAMAFIGFGGAPTLYV